ncbi:exosome complex exonuclease Rrp41 [Candidatus Woesearchaeota archaeon]|nr:exosome complex exonuclease Rrp41 [Candidatus Woesearchaeota archaeon]
MAEKFKRPSGRKYDEARKIEAEAGIIGKADGSARFKIGDTEAYAAVYGPRELHPKFLQDPKTGVLRCNYNMLPFAGDGTRVRPGPSRRSKEITHVTESALRPILDLTDYPNSVVDVFIELPQTDAGSRCAGICAAAIALADAGLIMKDMVSAVSVGMVEGEILVDLDGEEEHMNENEGTDIPVAYIPSTEEITLLQMDGKIPKEDIVKSLELVKPALIKIAEVQRQALHKKYQTELQE